MIMPVTRKGFGKICRVRVHFSKREIVLFTRAEKKVKRWWCKIRRVGKNWSSTKEEHFGRLLVCLLILWLIG